MRFMRAAQAGIKSPVRVLLPFGVLPFEEKEKMTPAGKAVGTGRIELPTPTVSR
jgi:hypothetical protein